MTTSTQSPSPRPSLTRQPQGLVDLNGVNSWSSDDGLPQGSRRSSRPPFQRRSRSNPETVGALLESVAHHLESLHTDLSPSQYDEAIRPLIDAFISLPFVQGFLPLNRSPPLPDSNSQLSDRVLTLESTVAFLAKAVEDPKCPATFTASRSLDYHARPAHPSQPSLSLAEKSPRPNSPALSATRACPSVVVSLGTITWSADQRPQPADICTKINDVLAASPHSQVRVSTVEWTQQDDLVIIGGPHTTAHELSAARPHVTEAVRALISSSPQSLMNPASIGANPKSPHSATHGTVTTPMLVKDGISSDLPTPPGPVPRCEGDNPKELGNIGGMPDMGTVGDSAKQPKDQPLPARKRGSSSLYPDEDIVVERMEKRVRMSDVDPIDSRSSSDQQRSQSAPTSKPTSGGWNPSDSEGVELEGMDNIVEVPDVGAAASSSGNDSSQPTGPTFGNQTPATGGSAMGHRDQLLGQPAPTPQLDLGGRSPADSTEKHIGRSQLTPTAGPASGRWLPAIREIKQQLDRLFEGGFERLSNLDQSDPPSIVHVRRCGVRLLMCCASLSPADFASPVGYLGRVESTSYYPTGDIRSDRSVAITTAMDCLDDLDANFHRKVDVRVATKLVELAQALSDLGLGEHALNISDFALDILEGLHVVAPNSSRLLLASVLSLRGNILCDLKRNDEARHAADRAVTLCKEEHRSQVTPVPELAFAMINYAVLLVSIGLADESAAMSYELNDSDESWREMKDVSALCKLCLSTARIGVDDDMALSLAEEAIELSSGSDNTACLMALAGAFLNKSKVLSSGSKTDAAHVFSAKAVKLLREISATYPVFSLFLAHALDTHSHQLMEANRNGESYSIRQDAVGLWQRLSTSAPAPIARPLALSLFELTKFRYRSSDTKTLSESLQIAESVVGILRKIEPLDGPRLADALYVVADYILELELDRTLEAATYAEESILYFRKAAAEDQKYTPDLIFSLSLASSCLAFTERANDAFEYSRQAVNLQHGRKAAEDTRQYHNRLCHLLCEVITRATEMGKQNEADPWFMELYYLSQPGCVGEIFHLNNGPGDSGQTKIPMGVRMPSSRFRKMNYWFDARIDAPGSIHGYTPLPTASRYGQGADKGKGKADPPSNPSGARTEMAEEIFSPGVASARAMAGQRGTEGFRNTSPQRGSKHPWE